MHEDARALAETVLAEASAFGDDGKPMPVAVRLTAEEWRVLKDFLAPLPGSAENSLFGMRVELAAAIVESDRFIFDGG